VGNFTFYLRFRRDKFHWFWNAAIPAIGLVVIVYALYKSFFKGLWEAGFAHGQSIVIFSLAWAVLGGLYVLSVRRRRPEAMRVTPEELDPVVAPGGIVH
jgi:hypothetical protein